MTGRTAKIVGGAVALYVTLLGCSDDGRNGADGGAPGDGGRATVGSGGAAGEGGISSGGGGGGAVGDPEKCPGARVAVHLGEPLSQRGTTTGRRDDVAPYCAAPEDTGADAVYELDATDAGTLTLTVAPTSAGMRPLLYVQRGRCGAVSAEVGCELARDVAVTTPDGGAVDAGTGGAGAGGATSADASSQSGGSSAVTLDAGAAAGGREGGIATVDAGAEDGGTSHDASARDAQSSSPPPPLPLQARVALDVASGDAVYVVVDSTGGPGDFVLDAQLTAASCGDGVVNPNAPKKETCDYGPTPPSGCTAECTFAPPGRDDQCAIDATGLSDGAPVTISGTTIGYRDDYTPPCAGVGKGGPDAVHAVLSDVAGIVTASVTADFDVVLHASDSCVKKALGGAIACSDGDRRDAPETITFPVVPSTPSFIVVDGVDAHAFGTYTLTLTFAPSP